jgi:uncharacterized protein (UPF0548 family)
MFSLRKPSSESIRRFLSDQKNRDYTYSAIGGTSGTPPAGFVVDHTRIQLGNGQSVFDAAKMAIKRWEHFQLSWVETSSTDIPIERGQVVGVLAWVFGVWCLNACRIVSVIDESGDVSRYGFVYGTLPGHVESGEERFQVEWNRSDDTVWYDILAFSRPNHFLTRLGYPMVRRIQKKFAHDSAAAMQLGISRPSFFCHGKLSCLDPGWKDSNVRRRPR